jgi:hypothetical protein
MPKCSYCDNEQHNINTCQVDNDLDKLLDSDSEPNFNNLSLKILKKIAVLTNYKTSLPKVKLISNFKRIWKVRKAKRDEELVTVKKELQTIKVQAEQTNCQVCMEELGKIDNCTTKCGHKFCSSCLIKWVMKKNSCPVCRSYLIDDNEYYWPLECYVGTPGHETPLQQRGMLPRRNRIQENIPEYNQNASFELEHHLEQHFGQEVEIIDNESTVHEGNMEAQTISIGNDPNNEYSSFPNEIEDLYSHFPGYNIFGPNIFGGNMFNNNIFNLTESNESNESTESNESDAEAES